MVAAAAPAALLLLPGSHRRVLLAEVLRALPRYHCHPLLHLGAGALHRAAVLPQPARRAWVIFLMATSC